MREHLTLTGHQTKQVLHQLTADGFLAVRGKTRNAIYSVAATTEADLRQSA